MNRALQPSWPSSTLFSTVIAVLALASPALADGGAPRNVERLLDTKAAPAGEIQPFEFTLPKELGLWTEPKDEIELREAQAISLSDFLPQGRLSQKPPFIDFSHFEMGAYIGVVDFSSDFKAKANVVAGISARVPVPGIPGEWGIFAQAFVSYINRDLPFYYPDKGNYWFGAVAGGDFTFIHDDVWYLRAQGGILYAYWNKVNALDNGVGILAGLQAGFYWIKHNNSAVVTINPQLSFDGSNWIGFVTVGFSVDF